jgi:hypothetical protein
MTYEQIHNLFRQRYNQNNWKQFLGEAFAKSRLLATPEILLVPQSGIASQVQKLGYITLNENGIERQIAVYEVTLAQGIILERNRVGLRNLLRKYWKDIDAAFIAYHRPETPNWRFTYVSELTGYDADGEFVKIKPNQNATPMSWAKAKAHEQQPNDLQPLPTKEAKPL